jgi:adenylate kinase
MLGAPGVGKGSQASRIAESFAIPHISTGDLFREQISANTAIGQKVSAFMSQGMLVPDEITIDILAKRLSGRDCQNGFVLDGFPRTLQQAASLDRMLEEMNISIDVVLNISLDDATIVRRITGRRTCPSCGAIYHIDDCPPKENDVCDRCNVALMSRADDSVEIIQKRLQVYYKLSRPLIEYYSGKGRFVHIESAGPIEDTTERVFEALETSLPQSV